MTIIATDSARLSQLVKGEYAPELAYCRQVATYNGAAATFVQGQLVGAAGVVPATAADIVGIVLQGATAALNTNTAVLTMTRGPATVSSFGLVLGALAAGDVAAALEAKGIQVLSAV